MKKILILTSKYLPNPSANGLNTKYIIDELKRRGYDITCISIMQEDESHYEKIDGVSIYRVPPSLYTRILSKEAVSSKSILTKFSFKIARIFRKVLTALLILKFPNFDLFQSQKLNKLIRSLHEQENFHCVIGIFKPFSNIAAVTEFRKKHKEVICGGYYLDLTNSIQRPWYLPKKLYEWLCYRGDINTFRNLDFVLMAKGGKETYLKPEYDEVRHKLEYIDFPTFLANMDFKRYQAELIDKTIEPIVLTYAGTLDSNYRNPSYLLQSLQAASEEFGKIELNIFGKGNCDDLINQYADSNTLKIIKHGYKSHDTIVQTMAKSEFLVNISNKLQNAVPSKIFELFSTGKPIINLSFDNKDITSEYFERYPAVFTIKVLEEDFNSQVKDFINFLLEERGKEYDREIIKGNFLENTPEFTVDIIEKRI